MATAPAAHHVRGAEAAREAHGTRPGELPAHAPVHGVSTAHQVRGEEGADFPVVHARAAAARQKLQLVGGDRTAGGGGQVSVRIEVSFDRGLHEVEVGVPVSGQGTGRPFAWTLSTTLARETDPDPPTMEWSGGAALQVVRRVHSVPWKALPRETETVQWKSDQAVLF